MTTHCCYRAIPATLLMLWACRAGSVTAEGSAETETGHERQAKHALTAAQRINWPGWTVEVLDGGRAQVRFRHTPVLDFSYQFWGPKWAWENVVFTQQTPDKGLLAVPGLGLEIGVEVAETAPDVLTFTYNVQASKLVDDVVGGGLEFHQHLDRDLLGAELAAPTLSRDPPGLDWPVSGKDRLRVVFEGKLAEQYFERNNPGRARFFLAGPRIRPGAWKVRMSIHLPASGVRRPSLAERYGDAPQANWHVESMLWDRWPVDLGYLNSGDRPAGRRGRVRAQGDKLVFEDGSEARFWGTNVQAYALFASEREAVANQAKRIAALGYNLVRLHHHDSGWVEPNVFIQDSDSTKILNAESLKHIDWWVKCLRDEGVYVWVDLHVGRRFRSGDGIDAFSELGDAREAKGFSFVNPSLSQAMQAFAKSYLDRINVFTERSYLEDPAVMGVLITNENDVSHHFGFSMTDESARPWHASRFLGALRSFARKNRLSEDEAVQIWRPGPAKLGLSDLEAALFQTQLSAVRSMEPKLLLATGNYWGEQGLYSLPSLALGDILDVHSYGRPEELSRNPRFEPNFVSWIGAGQVAGMPLGITEWNVEYPHADRFTAPMYLASVASLQGWDAPMLYGYLQHRADAPMRTEPWSTAYDPAIQALMPAAAVLFREQHVSQAKEVFELALTEKEAFFENLSPDTSRTLRTLVERSRLIIGLPDSKALAWDRTHHLENSKRLTDLQRDFSEAGKNEIVSDTGQLRRDWVRGVQTIDTQKTQAAGGWIGSSTVTLADSRIFVRSPAKAVVVLTSLDAKPLSESVRILVTRAARAVGQPGDLTPYLSEPIDAWVSLRNQSKLRMTPLDKTGQRLPSVAPRQDGPYQVFRLPPNLSTHWFELATDPGKKPLSRN
jgi:hypothetical protein